MLYNLKDKYKKDSEKIKNIQSWINEIENIEKKNKMNLIEKKKKLEEVKNKIEKEHIQKDEIEFERKKAKLIEEIEKAKNKTRDIKLENSMIFNSSDIVDYLELSDFMDGIEKNSNNLK